MTLVYYRWYSLCGKRKRCIFDDKHSSLDKWVDRRQTLNREDKVTGRCKLFVQWGSSDSLSQS